MSERKSLILGLGQTGLSVARFLRARGDSFVALDTRENPPAKVEIARFIPEQYLFLGEPDETLLQDVDLLVLSPGLSARLPFVERARECGIEVVGDIELFVRHANAPIIAITGSNGKSTVTALLGDMAKAAGVNVKVGGNIGVPALDLLQGDAPEFYILELSSFQLETTFSLKAYAAVILNISPDHMDRYDTLQDYIRSKAVIYQACRHAVFNRDEKVELYPYSRSSSAANGESSSFGLKEPGADEFGIRNCKGEDYLAYDKQNIMPVSQLKIAGRHNQANALAAMALAKWMGIPFSAMVQSLSSFPGLPHRTQWVAEQDGIRWFNDSKGTNVGASVAAIEGLEGPKVLIAGGEGKGADFTELAAAAVKNDVRAVVLYGKDAALIEAVMHRLGVTTFRAVDLVQAVALAKQHASSGFAVLFSPACASFDMFRNYEHRGEVFVACVQEALR